MRKRLVVTVAVVAGVLGPLLAAPAASAAPAAATCPSGYICVFADAGYGGQSSRYAGVPSYDDNLAYTNFNDKASSIINNSDATMILYSGTNRTGNTYVSRRRTSDSTFADNNFDNVASSLSIN